MGFLFTSYISPLGLKKLAIHEHQWVQTQKSPKKKTPALSSQRTRKEQSSKMENLQIIQLSALLQPNSTEKTVALFPPTPSQEGNLDFHLPQGSNEALQCLCQGLLPGQCQQRQGTQLEFSLPLASSKLLPPPLNIFTVDHLGSLDFYSFLTIESEKNAPPHYCGIRGGIEIRDCHHHPGVTRSPPAGVSGDHMGSWN